MATSISSAAISTISTLYPKATTMKFVMIYHCARLNGWVVVDCNGNHISDFRFGGAREQRGCTCISSLLNIELIILGHRDVVVSPEKGKTGRKQMSIAADHPHVLAQAS